jgi:hypothetical protein
MKHIAVVGYYSYDSSYCWMPTTPCYSLLATIRNNSCTSSVVIAPLGSTNSVALCGVTMDVQVRRLEVVRTVVGGNVLGSSKSRAMVWMTVSHSYPVPMNCAKWNGDDDGDDDEDDDDDDDTLLLHGRQVDHKCKWIIASASSRWV